MPIEGNGNETQPGGMVPLTSLFTTSNVIVAGKIKVKHPLMDETLLIVGFVIDDQFFNAEDFKVKGLEISYKHEKQDFYISNNNIIYPKIIIDKKTNHCSNYFEKGSLFYKAKGGSFLYFYSEGEYFFDHEFKNKYREETRFNYYMYEEITATIPKTAANTVFILCKYRENGVFKHCIFDFHELTLVLEN